MRKISSQHRALSYWKQAHWAFFTRECERLGRSPNPDMPVVCEQFEVVYTPTVAGD